MAQNCNLFFDLNQIYGEKTSYLPIFHNAHSIIYLMSMDLDDRQTEVDKLGKKQQLKITEAIKIVKNENIINILNNILINTV